MSRGLVAGLGPGGLSVAYVAPAQLDLGLGDCFDLIQVRVYFANPLLDVPFFFQYESRTYLVKLPVPLYSGHTVFFVYGIVVLLGPLTQLNFVDQKAQFPGRLRPPQSLSRSIQKRARARSRLRCGPKSRSCSKLRRRAPIHLGGGRLEGLIE